MAGDFLRRQPQISMAQFHAFRKQRPKEEKWELIDGVPMMMPPPTLVHQRISRDLETRLDLRLRSVQPEWQADREIGVLLSTDEWYNPEPDVTVIDADVAKDQAIRSASTSPRRCCRRATSPSTPPAATSQRCWPPS